MPTVPAIPATTAVVKLFRFITDTPKLTTGLLLTANFCPTAVLSRFSQGRVRQQRTNRTARPDEVQSLPGRSFTLCQPLHPPGIPFNRRQAQRTRASRHYTRIFHWPPVAGLASGSRYHWPLVRIQVSLTKPVELTSVPTPGILVWKSICRSTNADIRLFAGLPVRQDLAPAHRPVVHFLRIVITLLGGAESPD